MVPVAILHCRLPSIHPSFGRRILSELTANNFAKRRIEPINRNCCDIDISSRYRGGGGRGAVGEGGGEAWQDTND